MAVRKLKINKTYENKPCNWCGYELRLGDDGALCDACTSPHHASCWDSKDGCATPDCINAPFTVVSQPNVPEVTRLREDQRVCPHCGNITYSGDPVCRHCRLTPEGMAYEGPKTNDPEATKALTYAIVGLFCCPIILGPVAVVKGTEVKSRIDSDPTLGGRGLATAAQIIGVIDVVLFVLGLMLRLGA